MANVRKEDRVSDTDIKRLNHIGLGLKAIAEELGCHPATITLRLKAMNLKPTDTRRSFMEHVYNDLKKSEKEWLSHNLFNQEIDVKTFITTLIHDAYKSSDATAAAEAPTVELEGGTKKKGASKKKDSEESRPAGHETAKEEAPELPVVITGIVPARPNKLFGK